MSWLKTSADFYGDNADGIVLMAWDGESGPNRRISFLCAKTDVMKQFNLLSPWVDEAIQFGTVEDADRMLRVNEEIRGRKLTGIAAIRIGDIGAHVGGSPPHPKSAILGTRDEVGWTRPRR